MHQKKDIHPKTNVTEADLPRHTIIDSIKHMRKPGGLLARVLNF